MLNITSSEFIKSATKSSEYPKLTNIEFAFFGRSNAGKSSLINFILNRKNLVKVGQRPGMTQSLNFFFINATLDKAVSNKKVSFILTDLPGYGYAKLNKEGIKNIDSMLFEYCTKRENLKAMFLLMDIRREVTLNEIDTIKFFKENNILPVLVATKADKIPKTSIKKRISELRKQFEDVLLVPTSTLKSYGKREILEIIEEHLKRKL